MVFSRYITVLRRTGKLLRPNVLDVKVKHERSYATTTTINEASNSPEKTQTNILPNTKKSLTSSVIFNDDKNFDIERKSSIFSSQSAVDFSSSLIRANVAKKDFVGSRFICDDEALEDVELEPSKGPLDTCDEDLSHITPNFQPSFNFAAYANNSPLIQELVKLGVELHKLEDNPRKMEVLLKRNFSDLKPYIRFLHDAGVPAESIGAFITKNPFIFTQDMDDLHTRVRYLRAHKFEVKSIARIVTRNPHWLMFSTKRIDTRLGYFQREFQLNGANVRLLATKQPRLITYNYSHLRESVFAIREEMGFDKDETRSILLEQPRLFMKSRKHIVDVFDYVHNTMKLPHELIRRKPHVLTCRLPRLQTRHKYLETLGKNQYDPTKPLYVSPEALIAGNDLEFCLNVAKTSVTTFNLFQKTL